jgi:hemoglobin
MSATLYERLGGEDRIRRLVTTVVDMHLRNPLIKTRFEKYSDAERAVIERHVVEFFCMGSGGPQSYTGKDTVSTHKGMNINEQELVAAIDDFVAGMTEHGYADTERNEVVAILYSLKADVLRQ